MKRLSALLASLAGGLLLVSSACTMTNHHRRAGSVSREGQPVATAAPPAAGVPRQTGSPRRADAAAAPRRTPVQPTAQRAAAQRAAAQPAPRPTAHGVALTGYQGSASAAASCSCGACASGASAAGRHGAAGQRPYGYAPIPPVPNVYGIDRQEFLCDGGDYPPEASLRRDESIAGLQPEDTVVHYTTEAGDIEFDASNRVCVYAPRFASVRKITGALAGGRAVGAAGLDKPVGPGRFEYDLPGLVVAETTELGHAERTRGPDAMRDRNRGVPIEGVLQPLQAEEVLAALAGLSIQEINRMKDAQLAVLEKAAQAAVTWTIDESVEVAIEDLRAPTLVRDQQLEGFTVYEFPEAGRLRIGKLADRSDAAPGEEVNFTLRVDNVGDSPVSHVTIADNLTTRLEYVEGSQTSSLPADFETSPNDAQSLRLQWTLREELEVGETVILRFTTRVR